jgi:hypothetical protein
MVEEETKFLHRIAWHDAGTFKTDSGGKFRYIYWVAFFHIPSNYQMILTLEVCNLSV